MKVLLTGATGFIGRYVTSELARQGIDFVTVGRSTINKSSWQHISSNLLEVDDFSSILKQAQATHLIHMAWYSEHGKYWNSQINLDWMKMTTQLVEAFCLHGGQHITITGTCAEYDWSYGYCIEDSTPTNPSTIYGIAKDTTRRLTQIICHKYSVPIAWGRIFYPYGEGEATPRLIPSLFAAFRGEKKPFGVNANCYRDFLHVTDVATALVLLTNKKARGCINISSGEPVLIKDVVKLIAQLNSIDPMTILNRKSEREGEPKLLIGNNEKLIRYGWKNRIHMLDDYKILNCY